MNQVPTTHSRYEPLPWVFKIRVAQLVLTVLVLVLSSFAASQSIIASGLSFSFWVVVWSLFWIPGVVYGMTRVEERYRPNIIVLVFECASMFWWLICFSMLAVVSSAWAYLEYRRMVRRVVTYTTTSDDYATDYKNALDAELGHARAAAIATKIATALAAFNFALFVGTFVATGLGIHRQRKARAHATQNVGGEIGMVTEVHQMTTQDDVSKTPMQVQSQPLHQ